MSSNLPNHVDVATCNADVYVLAANLADREQFNHLDVSQWQFAVLWRATLEATGQESMAWTRAQQLATAIVGYDGLAAATLAASAVAE